MYVACKHNSCFPGKLPSMADEQDDNISIHVILQSLGLIPPSNEDALPPDVEFIVKRPGFDGDETTYGSQRRAQSFSSTDHSASPPSTLPCDGPVPFSYSDVTPPDDWLAMNTMFSTVSDEPEPMTNIDFHSQMGQAFSYSPTVQQLNHYSLQSSRYHKDRMSLVSELEDIPAVDFLPSWPGTFAAASAV